MYESSLSKVTLLYVEDESSIRNEMSEILEEECLELILAKDGEEGLEKYKKYNPDIILTDVRMPKMDGITMSQSIRELNSSIPIIISSAFSDSEYLLKAISTGIQHYLIKPINLEKLMDTLENIASDFLLKKNYEESKQLLVQYKEVVDASAILSKGNVDGTITYVNDAFIEISGYSRKELIGRNHNILRHPDMKKEVFRGLWKTLLSKKKWQGIIKNKAKDGSTYIVDSTITPILDLNNEIVEFISIRKDITQMELQKENLQQDLITNNKFINEFEKAIKQNTLFCRTDVNGIISMTSEEFDSLLGYAEGVLDNTDYKNILYLEDVQQVHEIQSSIENAKVWNGRLTHKSKSGDLLYLETSYIPIVGINNEVLEVFCFFVDVSESMHLNKEILATQREVISTMGAIGETRSQETGAHVKRVAEYSKLLALKYGLSIESAEELKMASPMHDIGKVAIPDAILNKPGKLTEDEFEIMKGHSALGYEMLRHSHQPLLKAAAIVANEHHEKWNGTGYPNKLSGEDIHIYARITAVADVFDALGHDRVYKKAWPLENILALFEEGKGSHFDPTLIDLFMDNLDAFIEIKKDFDGLINE